MDILWGDTMNIYHLIFLVLLSACGTDLTTEEEKELERLKAEQEQQKEAEEAQALLEPLQLKGYVSSGFDIKVDTEDFMDSEDFYTRQLFSFGFFLCNICTYLCSTCKYYEFGIRKID